MYSRVIAVAKKVKFLSQGFLRLLCESKVIGEPWLRNITFFSPQRLPWNYHFFHAEHFPTIASCGRNATFFHCLTQPITFFTVICPRILKFAGDNFQINCIPVQIPKSAALSGIRTGIADFEVECHNHYSMAAAK